MIHAGANLAFIDWGRAEVKNKSIWGEHMLILKKL
jgi:hypothetical protein